MIFIPLTIIWVWVMVILKESFLDGRATRPFEKFVDSPYSKKRLSPHLHKVLTQSNKVRAHIITMLLPPLQIGITVTTSLCITAVHCRQSMNLANGPCSTTCNRQCQMNYHCWTLPMLILNLNAHLLPLNQDPKVIKSLHFYAVLTRNA
jgi:hypothetical protein